MHSIFGLKATLVRVDQFVKLGANWVQKCTQMPLNSLIYFLKKIVYFLKYLDFAGVAQR